MDLDHGMRLPLDRGHMGPVIGPAATITEQVDDGPGVTQVIASHSGCTDSSSRVRPRWFNLTSQPTDQ